MVAAGDPISDAISRDKPAKCLYEVDQPIVIGICWELGWQLMPYQDAGNKVKSEQTNRKKKWETIPRSDLRCDDETSASMELFSVIFCFSFFYFLLVCIEIDSQSQTSVAKFIYNTSTSR